jgi:GR25 family glycosyltransferase involved in LPS biosynthesis
MILTKINIYYINLERALDRKINMENRYKNIKRIEAYDGNNIKKYNDIILKDNYGESWNEIGCSLSHVKAIKKAYENNDKEAIILEDDMSDEYKDKWELQIDEIVELSKNNNVESINLHCVNPKEISRMINIKAKFSKWNWHKWSNGAYYINRNGMKKILDFYIRDNKIDFKNNKKIVDYKADSGALLPLINSYVYTKPLFIHDNKGSYIQPKKDLHVHDDAYKLIKGYFDNIS